jgi:DNA repair protein RAD16
MNERGQESDGEAVEFMEKVSGEEVKKPSYLVELAKSGRAECKRCDEKIENKTLRIGVIVEGDWGLFTRWQHLHCTVFHRALLEVNDIDGYKELNEAQKAEVKTRFEESKTEFDDESSPIDPDEIVRNSWEQRLEPCADLLMPLLPYQKEGLSWMVHQELNDVHGGILADEMGMGRINLSS